jgi:transposase-like protein
MPTDYLARFFNLNNFGRGYAFQHSKYDNKFYIRSEDISMNNFNDILVDFYLFIIAIVYNSLEDSLSVLILLLLCINLSRPLSPIRILNFWVPAMAMLMGVALTESGISWSSSQGPSGILDSASASEEVRCPYFLSETDNERSRVEYITVQDPGLLDSLLPSMRWLIEKNSSLTEKHFNDIVTDSPICSPEGFPDFHANIFKYQSDVQSAGEHVLKIWNENISKKFHLLDGINKEGMALRDVCCMTSQREYLENTSSININKNFNIVMPDKTYEINNCHKKQTITQIFSDTEIYPSYHLPSIFKKISSAISYTVEKGLGIFLSETFGRVLENSTNIRLDNGKRRFVRNGNGQRKVLNPLLKIEFNNVTIPRVLDRASGSEIPYDIMLDLNNTGIANCSKDVITDQFIGGRTLAEAANFSASTKGNSNTSVSRRSRTYLKNVYKFQKMSIDRKYYAIYAGVGKFKIKSERDPRPVAVLMGMDENFQYDYIGSFKAGPDGIVYWKNVFDNINQRGIEEPVIIVSNEDFDFWDVAGRVFDGSLQQQSLFHLNRSVASSVPKKERNKVNIDFKNIICADNGCDAEKYFLKFINNHSKEQKCLNRILKSYQRMFSYLKLPQTFWNKVRNSNIVDSYFAKAFDCVKRARGCIGEDTLSSKLHFVGMNFNKNKKHKELDKLVEPRTDLAVGAGPADGDDSSITFHLFNKEYKFDDLIGNMTFSDFIEDINQDKRYKLNDIFKKFYLQAVLSIEETLSAFVNDVCDELIKDNNELLENTGRIRYVKNGKTEPKLIRVFGYGQFNVMFPRIKDNQTGKELPFFKLFKFPYERNGLEANNEVCMRVLAKSTLGEGSEYADLTSGYGSEGFSKSSISRNIMSKIDVVNNFQMKDINKDYHAIFIDATYVNVKQESQKACCISVIGLLYDGSIDYLGTWNVDSESTDEYRMVIRSLNARGLKRPKVIVGDGALGLIKAIEETYGNKVYQRCWFHIDKLVTCHIPNEKKLEAVRDLRKIYKADNYYDAKTCLNIFFDKYKKWPKCLTPLHNAGESLFTFFKSDNGTRNRLYTNNRAESYFSVVKSRTKRARGCLSHQSLSLIMLFAGARYSKDINPFEIISEIKTNIVNIEDSKTNTNNRTNHYSNKQNVNIDNSVSVYEEEGRSPMPIPRHVVNPPLGTGPLPLPPANHPSGPVNLSPSFLRLSFSSLSASTGPSDPNLLDCSTRFLATPSVNGYDNSDDKILAFKNDLNIKNSKTEISPANTNEIQSIFTDYTIISSTMNYDFVENFKYLQMFIILFPCHYLIWSSDTLHKVSVHTEDSLLPDLGLLPLLPDSLPPAQDGLPPAPVTLSSTPEERQPAYTSSPFPPPGLPPSCLKTYSILIPDIPHTRARERTIHEFSGGCIYLKTNEYITMNKSIIQPYIKINDKSKFMEISIVDMKSIPGDLIPKLWSINGVIMVYFYVIFFQNYHHNIYYIMWPFHSIILGTYAIAEIIYEQIFIKFSKFESDHGLICIFINSISSNIDKQFQIFCWNLIRIYAKNILGIILASCLSAIQYPNIVRTISVYKSKILVAVTLKYSVLPYYYRKISSWDGGECTSKQMDIYRWNFFKNMAHIYGNSWSCLLELVWFMARPPPLWTDQEPHHGQPTLPSCQTSSDLLTGHRLSCLNKETIMPNLPYLQKYITQL